VPPPPRATPCAPRRLDIVRAPPDQPPRVLASHQRHGRRYNLGTLAGRAINTLQPLLLYRSPPTTAMPLLPRCSPPPCVAAAMTRFFAVASPSFSTTWSKLLSTGSCHDAPRVGTPPRHGCDPESVATRHQMAPRRRAFTHTQQLFSHHHSTTTSAVSHLTVTRRRSRTPPRDAATSPS
jgi:hypothetical protein